jgi:drug/metabolite transporter (DMT)-like permease
MAQDPRVVLGYAVLYLVWGSTYLAMRIAAESLPPFLLASARFLVAGAVLFGIALSRGEGWPTRRAWRDAALVGLFLLVGGNGAVTWAVQHVPSGVAALLVATTPLWMSLFAREKVSRRTVLGLALGTLGIFLLVGPSSFGDGRVAVGGAVALVVASMSWSVGSLIQRASPSTSASASSGMQMLVGAVLLFVVSLGFGEQLDVAHVTLRSAGALIYLTVMGSLLGFTTYTWLMKREPAARVATYAYVNPVVAVVLGAWLGDEGLSLRVGVAAVVIIGAVVAILSSKKPPASKAS